MKINPDALRAERHAAGLTQEALARSAGVSRSVVQFAEQGRDKATRRAATIGKLAEAIGCLVADIADGETSAETDALDRQRERAAGVTA